MTQVSPPLRSHPAPVQTPAGLAQRGRWSNAALFLIHGMLMGSWATQIPLLLPRLGIAEGVLGLILPCFGIGAVTAMVWTGWLVNRFGSRAVSRGFALCAGLPLVAVALAPSVPLTAVALLAFGAVGGSLDVAMNANAVEVERQSRRAVMSSAHGFWSLGAFFGAGIGGTLIALAGPVGQALVVAGLAFALLALAWGFLLAEEARPAGAPRAGYNWPRGSAIYLLGALVIGCMVPAGAISDWSAIYLGKTHGAGVETAGLAFALYSGTMAAMRFAGDLVRRRFGAVSTLRASALLAGAGILAAGLAPDGWMAIAAFACAGLGFANLVPIAFSAAGNQPGLSPGAGIALVSMMGYAGNLVSPSIIGVLAQTVGFRALFVLLALLLAAVALNAGRVASADRA